MSNNNCMTLQGIERGRAEAAYRAVEAFVGEGDRKKKEYKSHVKKIPMLIKTNGLGATLAFIKGKDETYKAIYEQIEEWLRLSPLKYGAKQSGGVFLLREVLAFDSSKYRAFTQEVLVFTSWLKRLSDGVLITKL